MPPAGGQECVSLLGRLSVGDGLRRGKAWERGGGGGSAWSLWGRAWSLTLSSSVSSGSDSSWEGQR